MRRIDSLRRWRAGFTLLEVALVLVVSGIVVTIALPKLDLTRYRADATAQLVRTLLEQAQRAAIVQQHDMLVSFDTQGERVRLVWDANDDGAVSAGERVTWHSLEAGSRFAVPSAGVDGVVSAAVDGSGMRAVDGYPTLVIHRDGSTSGEAAIYLETVAHSRAFRAITVTQSTGRTDWYRQSATGAWSRGGL